MTWNDPVDPDWINPCKSLGWQWAASSASAAEKNWLQMPVLRTRGLKHKKGTTWYNAQITKMNRNDDLMMVRLLYICVFAQNAIAWRFSFVAS